MALQLHDVRDAEAFVAAIANRSQLELGPDDDEDLRQYLLAELWLLSVRYEPSRNRAFSAYAVAILRRRAVDWQRQRHGERSGSSKIASTNGRHDPSSSHSTTATIVAHWEGLSTRGAALMRQVGILRLAGILREGDRQRTRDLDTLGL